MKENNTEEKFIDGMDADKFEKKCKEVVKYFIELIKEKEISPTQFTTVGMALVVQTLIESGFEKEDVLSAVDRVYDNEKNLHNAYEKSR